MFVDFLQGESFYALIYPFLWHRQNEMSELLARP